MLGKVISARNITSSDDPGGFSWTIYTINPSLVFKGNPNRIVKVWSENTSSRFPMQVGGNYLLFLSVGFGNKVYVDSCGNSGRVE